MEEGQAYGEWEEGLDCLSCDSWLIRYCREEEDKSLCALLRSRVFLGEEGKEWEEGYDGMCDHVVMLNCEDGDVMGCYRLLREDMLPEGGVFYGEREFCMKGWRKDGKKKVELGRFCVGEGYRGGYVMDRLWRSVGLYLRCFDLEVIFGCVSFKGRAGCHEEVMRWLRRHYGDGGIFVPRGRGWFGGEDVGVGYGAKDREMWRRLPVLMRGYLLLGGRVSEGFYEDEVFGCTDMCVSVDVEGIPARYWCRLDRKLEGVL